MLVSIVIPCYNSEKTIGKVVELAVEEFRKLEGYECEFVLVNDYSPGMIPGERSAVLLRNIPM